MCFPSTGQHIKVPQILGFQTPSSTAWCKAKRRWKSTSQRTQSKTSRSPGQMETICHQPRFPEIFGVPFPSQKATFWGPRVRVGSLNLSRSSTVGQPNNWLTATYSPVNLNLMTSESSRAEWEHFYARQKKGQNRFGNHGYSWAGQLQKPPFLTWDATPNV